MQRWEYLTKFVEANVQNIEAGGYYSELVETENLQRNSPQTMIPELNQLGEKGWELVHMEPVIVGRNHDVLVHPNNMTYWANNYFCVFKRAA